MVNLLKHQSSIKASYNQSLHFKLKYFSLLFCFFISNLFSLLLLVNKNAPQILQQYQSQPSSIAPFRFQPYDLSLNIGEIVVIPVYISLENPETLFDSASIIVQYDPAILKYSSVSFLEELKSENKLSVDVNNGAIYLASIFSQELKGNYEWVDLVFETKKPGMVNLGVLCSGGSDDKLTGVRNKQEGLWQCEQNFFTPAKITVNNDDILLNKDKYCDLKPKTPISIIASPVLGNKSLISWQMIDYVKGFTLAYGETNAANEREINNIAANTNKIYVSDLKPNTQYYFKLRSRNKCGYSDWSSIVHITTLNNLDNQFQEASFSGSIQKVSSISTLFKFYDQMSDFGNLRLYLFLFLPIFIITTLLAFVLNKLSFYFYKDSHI